jgi:hypothetical protein
MTLLEAAKQALKAAKRNERHRTVAETRYWLNQYRMLAEQAIAAQRQWVGLTDADRREFAAAQYSWDELCSAVEAKLKERNHD